MTYIEKLPPKYKKFLAQSTIKNKEEWARQYLETRKKIAEGKKQVIFTQPMRGGKPVGKPKPSMVREGTSYRPIKPVEKEAVEQVLKKVPKDVYKTKNVSVFIQGQEVAAYTQPKVRPGQVIFAQPMKGGKPIGKPKPSLIKQGSEYVPITEEESALVTQALSTVPKGAKNIQIKLTPTGVEGGYEKPLTKKELGLMLKEAQKHPEKFGMPKEARDITLKKENGQWVFTYKVGEEGKGTISPEFLTPAQLEALQHPPWWEAINPFHWIATRAIVQKAEEATKLKELKNPEKYLKENLGDVTITTASASNLPITNDLISPGKNWKEAKLRYIKSLTKEQQRRLVEVIMKTKVTTTGAVSGAVVGATTGTTFFLPGGQFVPLLFQSGKAMGEVKATGKLSKKTAAETGIVAGLTLAGIGLTKPELNPFIKTKPAVKPKEKYLVTEATSKDVIIKVRKLWEKPGAKITKITEDTLPSGAVVRIIEKKLPSGVGIRRIEIFSGITTRVSKVKPSVSYDLLGFSGETVATIAPDGRIIRVGFTPAQPEVLRAFGLREYSVLYTPEGKLGVTYRPEKWFEDLMKKYPEKMIRISGRKVKLGGEEVVGYPDIINQIAKSKVPGTEYTAYSTWRFVEPIERMKLTKIKGIPKDILEKIKFYKGLKSRLKPETGLERAIFRTELGARGIPIFEKGFTISFRKAPINVVKISTGAAKTGAKISSSWMKSGAAVTSPAIVSSQQAYFSRVGTPYPKEKISVETTGGTRRLRVVRKLPQVTQAQVQTYLIQQTQKMQQVQRQMGRRALQALGLQRIGIKQKLELRQISIRQKKRIQKPMARQIQQSMQRSLQLLAQMQLQQQITRRRVVTRTGTTRVYPPQIPITLPVVRMPFKLQPIIPGKKRRGYWYYFERTWPIVSPEQLIKVSMKLKKIKIPKNKIKIPKFRRK